ncbi:hypothetical protein EBU24_04865 [bacterium]|nr:hypothetical protein [bacterium]
MKIIENTLRLITSVWEDPGNYPNNAAQFPLPSYLQLEDIAGHLLLQIEKSDREEEDFYTLGPEIMMMSMMEDQRIEIQGVLITSWQFCPRTHPNPNDVADLDIWKIIPYKWDSDNFEL